MPDAATTETASTGGIVKRSTVLADGRELIYFDDADTTLGPERAVDARVLDPRPEAATMRQDPLTGEDLDRRRPAEPGAPAPSRP